MRYTGHRYVTYGVFRDTGGVGIWTTSFESKEYFEHDLELRYKYNQDPCFPDFHFHDSYEVFYSIGGGMQYLIEDSIYSLNPGDLFIINNYEIHKPLRNPKAQYERIVMIINPEKIKEIAPQQSALLLSCFTSRKRGEHNKINLSDAERRHYFELVEKIRDLNPHEMGYQTLKELYFVEFLVYLKPLVQDQLLHHRRLRAARAQSHHQGDHRSSQRSIHVPDHPGPAGRRIPYEQILYVPVIQEHHRHHHQPLYRGAAAGAGQDTTAPGVQRHRYQRAQCGFQNYTHFIRTFKKHFSVSPKQFLKDS